MQSLSHLYWEWEGQNILSRDVIACGFAYLLVCTCCRFDIFNDSLMLYLFIHKLPSLQFIAILWSCCLFYIDASCHMILLFAYLPGFHKHDDIHLVLQVTELYLWAGEWGDSRGYTRVIIVVCRRRSLTRNTVAHDSHHSPFVISFVGPIVANCN